MHDVDTLENFKCQKVYLYIMIKWLNRKAVCERDLMHWSAAILITDMQMQQHISSFWISAGLSNDVTKSNYLCGDTPPCNTHRVYEKSKSSLELDIQAGNPCVVVGSMFVGDDKGRLSRLS